MHTATLLPSGKVLVAGGFNGSVAVTGAELYDPSSNTWSSAGTLIAGRYFHTATLMPSGKVLVACGRHPGYLASAELYDSVTNTWSQAGSLAAFRYLHTATLLPTGEVLITGGQDNNPLASAELYDPATNNWQSAGNLAEPRSAHSATLLPSGEILLAGGRNRTASGGLFSAERYRHDFGNIDTRHPVVTAPTTPIAPGDVLELDGSGFTGDSEASSGGSSGSPTNSPLVQLRRLDNDHIYWTTPAVASVRSDIAYQTSPLPDLAAGHYLLTLLVNAIPSVSHVIAILPSYIVTPSTAGGGNIDPNSDQLVGRGETRIFSLAADPNHHIDSVVGTCGGTLSGSMFTTLPILANCSVVAQFAIDTHQLIYAAAAHGTISGPSAQTVSHGADGAAVVAQPDPGFHFVKWSDASTMNPRIDTLVTSDLSVIASFAIDTFTVTSVAGANGTITPENQTIQYGNTAEFTVVPELGYSATLTGDTCTVAPSGGLLWTSSVIAADCAVVANFALIPTPVLVITVTDDHDYATYGSLHEYVVTVRNTSSFDATDVALSNSLPAQIDATATMWICEDAASGACEPSGAGGLNIEGVIIQAEHSLTWRVNAPVLLNAPGDTVEFTVSVTVPDDSSVTATDTNTLVLFRNGFDPAGE